MLKDACGFKRIYLRCGYTDLRKGIDGLSVLIKEEFGMDPYEEGCVFLFCGRRPDRIKALVYEGDGFVLLYKRLSDGRFQWSRSIREVKEIEQEQFKALMEGFAVIQKQTIKNIAPQVI